MLAGMAAPEQVTVVPDFVHAAGVPFAKSVHTAELSNTEVEAVLKETVTVVLAGSDAALSFQLTPPTALTALAESNFEEVRLPVVPYCV